MVFKNDQAANIAEAILLFRRDRDSLFSADLFSEPSWVLLLELFIADARGLAVTPREVGARNDIKESVITRWVRYLQQKGLVTAAAVISIDDPVSLTVQGLDRMEQLMRRARLSQL